MLEKMNSKEALRILSECANGEKKLIFSDSLDLERIIRQDLDRKEQLERENKELEQNLVKFDNDHFQLYLNCVRAIGILRHNLEITKTNNICNQPIIEVSCNMFVTKEQCELLEEVLKDARKN